MNQYVKKSDFSRVINDQDLNDLLDEASIRVEGKTSNDVLEEAVEMAVSQVEAILSTIYEMDVEFSKRPKAQNVEDTREKNVLRHVLNIAVYWLCMTIEPRDIPELREMNYKSSIMELEKVRDGELIYKLQRIQPDAPTRLTTIGGNSKFISKPYVDPLTLEEKNPLKRGR